MRARTGLVVVPSPRLMRLAASSFFLLTSFYCLLAFFPYTYQAFIQAPPYEWMQWFAERHALLYWLVLGALLAGEALGRRRKSVLAVTGIQALPVAYLSFHPLLRGLQSDWSAYSWSLAALLPILALAVAELWSGSGQRGEENAAPGYASYPNQMAVAAGLAVGYGIAAGGNGPDWLSGIKAWELTGWSTLSHIVVAVAAVSVVNLAGLASTRTSHPRRNRRWAMAILAAIALWWLTLNFLSSTFGLRGWPAHTYAGLLAATLACLGLSFSASQPSEATAVPGKAYRIALLPIAGAAAFAGAILVPLVMRGGDWDGILQRSLTAASWLLLAWAVQRLWPRRAPYSLPAIVALLAVSLAIYAALRQSAFLWSSLGSSDDDVAREMERYSVADLSFGMAHSLLGNGPGRSCDQLCGILLQYTDIRDVKVNKDVALASGLGTAPDQLPNIFILVVDSLRPDYLGAYNPEAHFSPHLDRFASESVVLKNVYTPYAGTTLAEPAIWSGTLLLHSHYMQPFHKVNGLEKLAQAHGYRMVISYDTVLREVLSPSDEMLRLDLDKERWNEFEACSSLREAEAALDAREADPGPVLFYAQPMNLHQFAINDMPRPGEDWQTPGFNRRVSWALHQVDECFGEFIRHLKDRGIYENSIVVVTSDHGDSLGDGGRFSHSLAIFPEIIRVPLVIHLPERFRREMIYDDSGILSLTDITPSLYYLLGYRDIPVNPVFGRPIFVRSRQELERYRREELLLASDVRPVYGVATEAGRYLYAVEASPQKSYFFDLAADPTAQHNQVTPDIKKKYDQLVLERLGTIADFYGYHPKLGATLAASDSRP